jgi:uroporphyrinogen-III synthase
MAGVTDTVARVLRGYTVGITADRRWDEQAALLERRGATVLHGPAIRTLPLGSDAPLRAVTESLIANPPDCLVANTGLGIRSWFSAAENWGLGEALHHALSSTRIYARGPKASGAVHTVGLEVAARAGTERLSEAVDLAIADLASGEIVAFQVDGGGPTAELERLTAAGAHVVAVPVYKWTLPEDDAPAVRLAEAVIARKVHAVTFTAGPAVRNWMRIAETHALGDELRAALCHGEIVIGCVGPVCADVAHDEGIHSPRLVVPSAYRLGPLVRAVAEELVRGSLTVDLGGRALVIAGTNATVDGQDLALTDNEARILFLLATRLGMVTAKTELATIVWRDASLDPHTVEMAVARLRARLQPLGMHIDVVRRRGYLLRA